MALAGKHYLGFVSGFERVDRSVRVDLELIEDGWVQRVLDDENGDIPRFLRGLFGQRPVWPTLFTLPPGDQYAVYMAHLWFALRILAEGDQAPLSLARLTLSSRHPAVERLVESSWIRMQLDEGQPLQHVGIEPPDDFAFHTALGEDAADDEEPTQNKVIEFWPVPNDRNAVLQALHLPQVHPAFRHMTLVHSPASHPPLSGSSATPRFQPFVGVMNVGHGACAGIWDDAGELIAFLDCGQPTTTNQATLPPKLMFPPPCCCEDPLVLLSHWDYDHFALARTKTDMYQLRWIVPQQHVGPVALKICGRVMWDGAGSGGTGGGQLFLWLSPTNTGTTIPKISPMATHVELPWGVAERCSGFMPTRNESGCAVFVVVHDSASTAKQVPRPLARRGRPISPQPYSPPPVPSTGGPYGMAGLNSLLAGFPIIPVPGLASGSISGFASTQRLVLAPGDAAFENIPAVMSGLATNIAGLIATHHGADTFWSPPAPSHIPPSLLPAGPIVYSYGLSRSKATHCHRNSKGLGHPTPGAIGAYAAQGWTYRMNTCDIAQQSAQPPPAGAARQLSTNNAPLGNAALGWQNGGAIACDIWHGTSQPATDAITRKCPKCGVTREFQF